MQNSDNSNSAPPQQADVLGVVEQGEVTQVTIPTDNRTQGQILHSQTDINNVKRAGTFVGTVGGAALGTLVGSIASGDDAISTAVGAASGAAFGATFGLAISSIPSCNTTRCADEFVQSFASFGQFVQNSWRQRVENPRTAGSNGVPVAQPISR